MSILDSWNAPASFASPQNSPLKTCQSAYVTMADEYTAGGGGRVVGGGGGRVEKDTKHWGGGIVSPPWPGEF